MKLPLYNGIANEPDYVTIPQTLQHVAGPALPLRFAVAATFTAEPLRPTIAFWGRQMHADVDVRFAPYNQVLQTLVNPASDFATNTQGANVALIRIEDLGQFRTQDPESIAQLQANVEHLVDELRAAAARVQVPLLVCVCPSTPGHAAKYRELEQEMLAGLQGAPGLHCIDHADVSKLYPVETIHDLEGERLGKIPYTESFYCALATMIVRVTHALVRPAFKVIALDCDNTLWSGICGEDGPEGVVLDEPRRALHDFMLQQRSAGMLLTLASKNNEDDVLETFRVHPEMPLRIEHFVARRLNWEPKGANIASLAQQLSLGLDSFVFVDDNPKECAEVVQAAPEVVAVTLPADSGRIAHFLRHVWAFDHPVVTAEDRKRSAYYEQMAEFGDAIQRAGSLQDFVASLKLRVSVRPLSEPAIPRVAQLTQRTNQFNTTGIRRTEAAVQALAGAGYRCYTAEVSDRFGEYGLTGILITRESDATLVVDSMLLSCRVLGRGVEHRLLAFAGQTAVDRGLRTVEVPFVETVRNQPARQFLESIDIGERRTTADGMIASFPAAQLAELQWKPAEAGLEAAPEATAKAPAHARRKAPFGRIANELSTVPDILAAMRRETRGSTVDGSMSETEAAVAAIWSDLLERPGIQPSDNFFDLGGHSLLAVLLLLRIRESFGVELSVDDVYSGTLTLADLATRIEAARLGGLNPDEYAALLAEIESMSDEEASELLAREDPGQQG